MNRYERAVTALAHEFKEAQQDHSGDKDQMLQTFMSGLEESIRDKYNTLYE